MSYQTFTGDLKSEVDSSYTVCNNSNKEIVNEEAFNLNEFGILDGDAKKESDDSHSRTQLDAMKEEKLDTSENNLNCTKQTIQYDSTYSESQNLKQELNSIKHVENPTNNLLKYSNQNSITEKERDKKVSVEIMSNKRTRFTKELTGQIDANPFLEKETSDVGEHFNEVQESSEKMFFTESPEILAESITVNVEETQSDAFQSIDAVGTEVTSKSTIENFKICQNGENTNQSDDIIQRDVKKMKLNRVAVNSNDHTNLAISCDKTADKTKPHEGSKNKLELQKCMKDPREEVELKEHGKTKFAPTEILNSESDLYKRSASNISKEMREDPTVNIEKEKYTDSNNATDDQKKKRVNTPVEKNNNNNIIQTDTRDKIHSYKRNKKKNGCSDDKVNKEKHVQVDEKGQKIVKNCLSDTENDRHCVKKNGKGEKKKFDIVDEQEEGVELKVKSRQKDNETVREEEKGESLVEETEVSTEEEEEEDQEEQETEEEAAEEAEEEAAEEAEEEIEEQAEEETEEQAEEKAEEQPEEQAEEEQQYPVDEFEDTDEKGEYMDQGDEEEEEDDDEETETLQGFIVNEIPANEVPSDHYEEDEEEILTLDEDDLELIAENTGAPAIKTHKSKRSKFRRLKRFVDDYTSDDDNEKSQDVELKTSVIKEKTKSRMSSLEEQEDLSDLYGDNDDLSLSDDKSVSDMSDYGVDIEVSSLIRNIFGDVRTVFEILGRRRRVTNDDYSYEYKAAYEKNCRSITTNSLNSKNSLLGGEAPLQLRSEKNSGETEGGLNCDSDSMLWQLDKPERHSHRYKLRKAHYTDDELKREAEWISLQLVSNSPIHFVNHDPFSLKKIYQSTFGAKSNYYDPETTSVIEDIEEKICLFLYFLLNEHLEVPVIMLHHGHRLCPPLNERFAWYIVEMDQQWSSLSKEAQFVSNLLARLPKEDPDISILTEKINNFKNEQDVEDVRHYISFYYSDLAFNDSIRKGRKQASSFTGVSWNDSQHYGIEKNWTPFLLTPSELAKNIEMSEVFTNLIASRFTVTNTDLNVEKLPFREPPLVDQSMESLNSWLSSLVVGPFNSSSRVLEAILSLESRKLSVSVQIRELLRRWFYNVAAITTVLTPVGENIVNLGHRTWAALNLRRKPVKELISFALKFDEEASTYDEYRHQLTQKEYICRKATAFLDILDAESKGHVTLIIHPVGENEVLPWRDDSDSLALSVYKKNDLLLLDTQSYDKMDAETLNTLIDILTNLYVISPTSIWATEVQKKILKRLVFNELIKFFRKELRKRLQCRAEDCVAFLCYDSLKYRLSLQSYRNQKGKSFRDRKNISNNKLSNYSDSDSSASSKDVDALSDEQRDFSLYTSPRVCGLIVHEEGTTIDIHVLCVDRNGFPTHFARINSFSVADRMTARPPLTGVHWKTDESRKKMLQEFLEKSACEVVVIGVSGFSCRYIKTIVASLLKEMSKKSRFDILFGSLEIAHLYVTSTLCSKEHKRAYGIEGCQAIAIARFIQDPLSSYVQLWHEDSTSTNLLHYLRYHPSQHLIPPERLQNVLEQAIVTAVASAGVDINLIRNKPHMQCLLKFVPGLGPKKAECIMFNMNKTLTCRSELLKLELTNTSKTNLKNASNSFYNNSDSSAQIVGPVVFNNCASFIRISRSICWGKESADPLACTRIHPTYSYSNAYKTARDAFEHVKRLTPQDCAISVMRNPRCLDELDLEEYSYILESRNQPRMLPHVEMIRKELESPFHDSRHPFQEPVKEDLFYLFTKENSFEFRPGTEVLAHVVDTRSKGAVTFIIPPSNVVGNATDSDEYVSQESSSNRNYSSKHEFSFTKSSQVVLALGNLISCYIKSIDFSHFSVELVLSDKNSARFLSSLLFLQNPGLVSPCYTFERILSYICQHKRKRGLSASMEEKKKPYRFSSFKRIDHPRFRLTSPSKAAYELKHGNIGEALITPFEKSHNVYILTIKVCTDPLMMKTVHIQENYLNDKGYKVGSKFYVDIDLIFGEYVEGLRINLNETFSFEKYYNGRDVKEVENILVTKQRSKESSSGVSNIEWGITIDSNYPMNHPGVRFHLIAITSNKSSKQIPGTYAVLKDGIYVTSEGFKLWNQKEVSLRQLTNWWKTRGFFQRAKLINEYNLTKRNMVKNKNSTSRRVN
ncbi:transcription elongation factor SPT6-like isoform X2 [Hylaeus volcanicus]|uniref:transcription elongation factor SPT6-like isoform X2 n=1 Tax=Hylaeus volcanicus TaxID=313075 RepID=UPI0023B83AFE|nr:transcription elongation factor SPT6-like isoform X2 [Hylaeus volcanicus]